MSICENNISLHDVLDIDNACLLSGGSLVKVQLGNAVWPAIRAGFPQRKQSLTSPANPKCADTNRWKFCSRCGKQISMTKCRLYATPHPRGRKLRMVVARGCDDFGVQCERAAEDDGGGKGERKITYCAARSTEEWTSLEVGGRATKSWVMEGTQAVIPPMYISKLQTNPKK